MGLAVDVRVDIVDVGPATSQTAARARSSAAREQDAKGSDYRVLNNAFSRQFSQKVGFYGISTDCSNETQSGN